MAKIVIAENVTVKRTSYGLGPDDTVNLVAGQTVECDGVRLDGDNLVLIVNLGGIGYKTSLTVPRTAVAAQHYGGHA